MYYSPVQFFMHQFGYLIVIAGSIALILGVISIFFPKVTFFLEKPTKLQSFIAWFSLALFIVFLGLMCVATALLLFINEEVSFLKPILITPLIIILLLTIISAFTPKTAYFLEKPTKRKAISAWLGASLVYVFFGCWLAILIALYFFQIENWIRFIETHKIIFGLFLLAIIACLLSLTSIFTEKTSLFLKYIKSTNTRLTYLKLSMSFLFIGMFFITVSLWTMPLEEQVILKGTALPYKEYGRTISRDGEQLIIYIETPATAQLNAQPKDFWATATAAAMAYQETSNTSEVLVSLATPIIIQAEDFWEMNTGVRMAYQKASKASEVVVVLSVEKVFNLATVRYFPNRLANNWADPMFQIAEHSYPEQYIEYVRRWRELEKQFPEKPYMYVLDEKALDIAISKKMNIAPNSVYPISNGTQSYARIQQRASPSDKRFYDTSNDLTIPSGKPLAYELVKKPLFVDITKKFPRHLLVEIMPVGDQSKATQGDFWATIIDVAETYEEKNCRNMPKTYDKGACYEELTVILHPPLPFKLSELNYYTYDQDGKIYWRDSSEITLASGSSSSVTWWWDDVKIATRGYTEQELIYMKYFIDMKQEFTQKIEPPSMSKNAALRAIVSQEMGISFDKVNPDSSSRHKADDDPSPNWRLGDLYELGFF